MYVPWGGGFDANYIIFSEMLKISTIFLFTKKIYLRRKKENIFILEHSELYFIFGMDS
jgi:hypothetical protein